MRSVVETTGTQVRPAVLEMRLPFQTTFPGYVWIDGTTTWITQVRGIRLAITYGNFLSDLTTLPWWSTWRLKKLDWHVHGAVLHDWLLQHRDQHDFTDDEIDLIAREVWEYTGINPFDVKMLYTGIRAQTRFIRPLRRKLGV